MTENQSIVIGIDFGTTFSTACYYDTNSRNCEIIKDEGGGEQYASMLQFKNSGILSIFGNPVKTVPNCNSIIQEVKRFIGRECSSKLKEMASKMGMEIEIKEVGE